MAIQLYQPLSIGKILGKFYSGIYKIIFYPLVTYAPRQAYHMLLELSNLQFSTYYSTDVSEELIETFCEMYDGQKQHLRKHKFTGVN